MKDHDKKKELSYLKYQEPNNLYRRAMPQSLPVNGLYWVDQTSQFNEDFIKKL